MPLATINSVWIGPALGPVHAACLRSFVRHGHRVVLHAYGRPTDMPDGVELADAGNLLPSSRIIRYTRGGSPAIFSNFLRYEIQRQGLGLYVDCDCYCIVPMQDEDYTFGFEAAGHIANGVLKLPKDSPLVDDLCRLKDQKALIPLWASRKRQLYYRWRARLGLGVKLQDLPWGYTGPYALTWYAAQHDLHRYAAPIDAFYPVHTSQTPLLTDPDLTIADITTHRTRLLHLSNERLKRINLAEVPASSPLGIILAAP